MPVICGKSTNARMAWPTQYKSETEMIVRYLPNSQSLTIAPTNRKEVNGRHEIVLPLVGRVFVKRREVAGSVAQVLGEEQRQNGDDAVVAEPLRRFVADDVRNAGRHFGDGSGVVRYFGHGDDPCVAINSSRGRYDKLARTVTQTEDQPVGCSSTPDVDRRRRFDLRSSAEAGTSAAPETLAQ